MTTALADLDISRELEPVAERHLDEHLRKAKAWHPHDNVPWDDGRNFAVMGGIDWEPEQSRLSEVARTAMVTNLLTEDNQPSYHREISESFAQDGVRGTSVGRWTAEENRHAIVMRDYLVCTRAVDPVALEQARMAHMTTGVAKPEKGPQFLRSVAYVALQELATRISHRNTGAACNEPVAERMLQRIAADENLHMIFYRNLSAALDLAPDEAMHAVTDIVTRFRMPGLTQPNFRRNAVVLAKNGSYDLRQHLDVVLRPVLRPWNVFERTDLSDEGERVRDEFGAYLDELAIKATCFEEQRDRAAARQANRAAVVL
ncbi:acyl-ACP desaturase [Nocardia sp. CA-135953]|uniref:acyl-ACP desaturase n=1 Tax=Nocardia sp. CA-135953 TaxID=3239978 RepID=UPI003D9890A4